MTGEKLSNAITELDSDILDRYFTMKSSLEKKAKRRAWIKWTPLVAACLALVVFIVPSVSKTNFVSVANVYPSGAIFSCIVYSVLITST